MIDQLTEPRAILRGVPSLPRGHPGAKKRPGERPRASAYSTHAESTVPRDGPGRKETARGTPPGPGIKQAIRQREQSTARGGGGRDELTGYLRTMFHFGLWI